MEFLVLFFRLSLMSYIRDIMLEEGYYIAQDVILLIYALPPETCHLWFTTRDLSFMVYHQRLVIYALPLKTCNLWSM